MTVAVICLACVFVIMTKCVGVKSVEKSVEKTLFKEESTNKECNEQSSVALIERNYVQVYNDYKERFIERYSRLELTGIKLSRVGLKIITTSEIRNIDEEVYGVTIEELDSTSEKVVWERAELRRAPSLESEVIESIEDSEKITTTGVVRGGFSLVTLDDEYYWVESKSLCTADEYEEKISSMVLLRANKEDASYKGQKVTLDEDDRDLLERLVMGEAGDQGFIGAALVAQCIRDAIVYNGYESVAQVRKKLAYSGKITEKPNKHVRDAVAYIFDKGGCAVRHRMIYFYMPSVVKSSFHESQTFIVEYKDHRFFDKRGKK